MNRKVRLYLLSAALFGTVGGIIFGISEIVLRAVTLSGVTESRDHVVQTATLPVTFRANYEGRIWDVPFRTNNFGFRGEDDFSLEPVDGEIRVLSLGDSIGFGLGIEAALHYTQVAERLLEPSLSDGFMRIVNAGGQGYSPSSYAVFLQETGLALQPDLVLLEIELCNDVTDEALVGRVFGRERPQLPRAVTGGRYFVGWDGNLLAGYSIGPFLFERTYVYTNLSRRFLNLRFTLGTQAPVAGSTDSTYYHLGYDRALLTAQRVETGWAGLFDTLQATHALMEENRVQFLLMIMPSRYIFDDRAAGRGDFARQLVRRAVTESERRDLPFIDMTETIGASGGTELFFDFAHLTAEGNRIVGNRLGREIGTILGLQN